MEELCGLAEVVAGAERPRVRLRHERAGLEPVGDPLERALDRAGVEPADEAEREEVLGALSVARLDPDLLARLLGDRGHRDLIEGEVREAAVGQRVRVVAGLGQRALVEGVEVGDDRRSALDVGHVRTEPRRVHRHEHVWGVAVRRDLVVRDVDLKRRHASERARWCPDLRWIVREGRQVVAQDRAGCREPVASQLHAITGVTGEADDHPVDLLGDRRVVPFHAAPIDSSPRCLGHRRS